MPNIYDVEPQALIHKAAQELEKLPHVKIPAWAYFVKTGMHKERPPANEKWWFVRAAAVLRTVYKLGPVGVSKLRKKYGGKKRRGHQPPEYRVGAGNHLRKILQQLEKEQLIKQATKGVHKGRVVTAKGKSFLDTIAAQLYKAAK
ncbi:30S ribosomal protein S19e [Candidatus Woesearchaeota archaeon]|nr:30S ribosomal protein S19e [Candidatus Woesearchaeota archaeon]